MLGINHESRSWRWVKRRANNIVKGSSKFHCFLLILEQITAIELRVFRWRVPFLLGDSIPLGVAIVSPSILGKEKAMKVWFNNLVGSTHVDKETLTRLEGIAIHP
jgi:hypothetical protein